MTELEKLCEQALYEEIRELGDGKSIVRDVPTGRLFYRKELKVYNLQVFEYLKEHRSRHVPRIESVREDDGTLIVIEEYVQGRTLEHILEETEEEITFQERIRILTEICDGLTFLHSAQPPIIHRDLKASNIMLTEDGVVKIIDYDAAKIYVSGEKQDTVLMGTHGIAAPEQYGFAPSDVRTDIYGLGKLIERMLPDNVDADRIVARATHIDPKKRYASATQIRDQIVRIREQASSLDTRLERVLPGFDPRKKGHRIAARLSLAIFFVAVLAAAGFSVWRFGIYPGQRRQAMAQELEIISSGQTQDGAAYEPADQINQFLTEYPYEKMSEEDQFRFRSSVENRLSKYSDESEESQQIREVLADQCGGEEFADLLLQYAKAEKNLSNTKYEEAFEILEPLRKTGAMDAEDKWTDAVQRCSKRADSMEESFKEDGSISFAKNGLKLYALLAETVDEEEAAKALEAYDRLFHAAIDVGEAKSKAGEYDTAERYFNLLKEAEPLQDQKDINESIQAEIEEKIKENTYRDADDKLANKYYESACKLFDSLGDYSDAPAKAAECRYWNAEHYMEEKEYARAAESYALCPGYRDADEKILEAKYLHCESCAEKPDDEAYEYIEELLAGKYPGADSVRDTMYQWHVEITNGLDLLMGSQQSSHIRVFLYGGPPEASTRLRLETTDNVNGERVSWTSPEACSRGGHVDASYNANTFEFSIFEREHTINVYSDDGKMIGTWTGVFTKDFMKD